VAQVDVTFDLNADGILSVTACDRRTGVERRVTIKGASTLDSKEVERMVAEAAQYREQDRAKKERIERYNRAENMAINAERQLKELSLSYGYKLSYDERKQIEGLVKSLKEAIAREDDARMDKLQTQLQEAIYALSRRLYEEEEEGGEEDDFIGGLLERVGKIAGRKSDSLSRERPKRPTIRIDDDDDDEWV